MNHNIKAGDTVRRITDNPYSQIRLGDTFTVYKVFEDDIYYKDGFALNYKDVELVDQTPLIHRQWKDLHDKGVELEWSFTPEDWFELPSQEASLKFNADYSYRVKDHGYDHYKALLNKIDLSFMINKSIVVETYGLASLARAFVERGAECGAAHLSSVPTYKGITNLNKCFGLCTDGSKHSGKPFFLSQGYTVLSFQELLHYPDAQKCQPEVKKPKMKTHNFKKGDIVESLSNHCTDTRGYGTKHLVTKDCDHQLWYKGLNGNEMHSSNFHEFKLHKSNKKQPTFKQEYLQPKETTMNPLDLILLSIFMQEDKPKDATNANHIAVLTEADGSYVGYIYADDQSDFDDVMRKPENESRKLHIFNYDSTIAQKPRKIVKVDRV